MNKKEKQLIHGILTNSDKSIEEIYSEVIQIFPNYLNEVKIKKGIYEKIEGIFHDGLGTYFEYLVYDEINVFFGLGLEESYKSKVIEKLKKGILLYNKFFPDNDYKIDFKKEVKNIEKGAKSSIIFIKQFIGDSKVTKVTASSQDFRGGNARDLYIDLENGLRLNFSLKTDKSGKVALFEGQTPDIFNKVYKRYFLLSKEEYSNIKKELFNTEDESIIFEDFQNIAFMTQRVMLDKLGLVNAEINNFKKAKITNKDVLKNCIEKIKHYKNGNDDAIILLVNRITGEIGEKTILDLIDTNNLKLEDFNLTPCIPRSYEYATEPGIKYKGKTFVSFQVKHKRGKYASNKFQDITIRLRTK